MNQNQAFAKRSIPKRRSVAFREEKEPSRDIRSPPEGHQNDVAGRPKSSSVRDEQRCSSVQGSEGDDDDNSGFLPSSPRHSVRSREYIKAKDERYSLLAGGCNQKEQSLSTGDDYRVRVLEHEKTLLIARVGELVDELEVAETIIEQLRAELSENCSLSPTGVIRQDISVEQYLDSIDDKKLALSERVANVFAFCVTNEYKPQKYGVFLSAIISRLLGLERQDDRELSKVARYKTARGKTLQMKTSLADKNHKLAFTRFKASSLIDYHIFAGYQRTTGNVFLFLLTMRSLREILPVYGSYAYGDDGGAGPLSENNISETANFILTTGINFTPVTKNGGLWRTLTENYMVSAEAIREFLSCAK